MLLIIITERYIDLFLNFVLYDRLRSYHFPDNNYCLTSGVHY
jgi:hypothetical protein